ncbi:MAG: thiamine diphosphokinase [Clostridia bacterium]|nr:thiamine diphosphokinase [Clostridia bacterium]
MTALIVTPYIEGKLENIISGKTFDLVICADASFDTAKHAKLAPDVVIGDFDHGSAPDFNKIIRVPREKDDTDTMLCIKYAVSHGADEILIAGGVGGRLDHTIANIQSLAYAEKYGVHAVLKDERNAAFFIIGNARVARESGSYLSLFAYGGDSTVTIKGTKYDAERVTLTVDFPLGVSNEITSSEAEIIVHSGSVLAIVSRE